MRAVRIIVAVDEQWGMGWQGTIPWHLPGDLKQFHKRTKNSTVIMGRLTWESLGCVALRHRQNMIVSKSYEAKSEENVQVFRSLAEAVQAAPRKKPVWVIGGANLIREALPYASQVILTRVPGNYYCDIHCPVIPTSMFTSIHKISYTNFEVHEMKRYNPQERAYLNLVKQVLRHGWNRQDRTRVGTTAVFGRHLYFSLNNNRLPLLTTKKVSFENIKHELLWFLRGGTNNQDLVQNGVHIWTANAQEYAANNHLTAEQKSQGYLGPIYGYQWRNFGGSGVDQIAQVVAQLQADPYSRRHFVSAWNPADQSQMALPPCHVSFQFFVVPETEELHCQVYQRSGDLGLGVPYNIASYALLTHLVAHVTGLKANSLKLVLGDTHVYNNHIDALSEQVCRLEYAFPFVHIKSDPSTNLWDIQAQDIELQGYNHHSPLQMNMAV